MSFITTNTAYRIDGHKAETELHQCPETKRLIFLQDFQSRLSSALEFDSIADMLDFLDYHNDGLTHLMNGYDIYQLEPNGGRELNYYGTIKEY